jgi:enamine deaminase RidA (YjgF/YER057c/UK114 family)
MRTNVSTGTPWEDLGGYSRAVRVGNSVWVSGTTASDADGVVQGKDAEAQARFILDKIAAALEEAGATLRDVVRTRIFVARLEDWETVARVHGDVFGQIRPANTLVQVAGLVDGRLVEVEADAVIDDDNVIVADALTKEEVLSEAEAVIEAAAEASEASVE